MDASWFPHLRCPVTGTPYDADPTRIAGMEVSEGFLVARGGREVRLILAGLAVLPRNLDAHLGAYGNVYERMPAGDSRIVRFVLGRAGHAEYDTVPFDELVLHYGDLVPADLVDEAASLAAEDAALARLLAALELPAGPGLDVGCGVGRAVFVMREYVPRALGVDRSIARARRARNVATTHADFFLPPAAGVSGKEVPLELDRLRRDGVDFVVADAESLPFSGAVFGLVRLRQGDGLGPWTDAAAAHREAVRVLAPGGILVCEGEEAPGAEWTALGTEAPFQAWRRS